MGEWADHPSVRLVARAILRMAESMPIREHFDRDMLALPHVSLAELHGCAYFWHDQPFIVITHNNELAYRVSDAADRLPVTRQTDYWVPNSRALAGWRVLIHDGPKDCMPTALSALAVVHSEADQSVGITASAV